MAKQFAEVSTSRGAPFGRKEYRADYAIEPRSVKLFRVRLDAGGYDDGGAYWGTGEPLYCAQDDKDMRVFCRAPNRGAAVVKLRIAPYFLARAMSSAEMQDAIRYAAGNAADVAFIKGF